MLTWEGEVAFPTRETVSAKAWFGLRDLHLGPSQWRRSVGARLPGFEDHVWGVLGGSQWS